MSHEFEYGWERFGDASFCVSTDHLSILLDKYPDGFGYVIKSNCSTPEIESDQGIGNVRKLECDIRAVINALERELDVLKKHTRDIGQLEFREEE